MLAKGIKDGWKSLQIHVIIEFEISSISHQFISLINAVHDLETKSLTIFVKTEKHHRVSSTLWKLGLSSYEHK